MEATDWKVDLLGHRERMDRKVPARLWRRGPRSGPGELRASGASVDIPVPKNL